MAAKVIFNLSIWILISMFLLGNVAEARPSDKGLDHEANGNNISKNNETTSYAKKGKICSIVVAGAVAGAVIGPLAIGVPLVLCLCGISFWGIMVRLIAACCASCIRKVPGGSCIQSLGAGTGMLLIKVACIVGIPIGVCAGGYFTNTYYHCFGSR